MTSHQKKRSRKITTPDGYKTCFVLREIKPRTELIRFVAGPDHLVYFDVAEKLPGRGMWMSADTGVLGKAIAKKLFSKALEEAVIIPENLEEQVVSQLKARVLSLMSLARRAGAVVFGYEAVKKALAGGSAVMAFAADDSSERGKDKLYHFENLPIYTFFSREELGQVTGQEAAVHVGILKSKVAAELRAAVHKLELVIQPQQKG